MRPWHEPRKPKAAARTARDPSTKESVGGAVFVAQLRWRDTDGRVRERQAERSTKSAALEALRRLRTEVETTSTTATADERAITVGDAIAAWISIKEIDRAPATLRSYRLVERKLAAFANRRVATLTRTDIRSAVERPGRMQSVMRIVLKAALRPYSRLVRDDLFPQRATSRPRRRTLDVWTAEQARMFLAHTDGSRFALAWRVALGTGMRQGEILALRWRNIHDGWIEVASSLDAVGKKVSTTKTAGSRRTVAIDADLQAALETKRGRSDAFVFATASGTPVSGRNLVRAFKAAISATNDIETKAAAREEREAAVLPDIRFHDARHSHATLLLQANVHPKIVSERLGHRSIKLTLDTYSHVLPNMQTEAAAVIGDVLGGTPISTKGGTQSGTTPKLRVVA